MREDLNWVYCLPGYIRLTIEKCMEAGNPIEPPVYEEVSCRNLSPSAGRRHRSRRDPSGVIKLGYTPSQGGLDGLELLLTRTG